MREYRPLAAVAASALLGLGSIVTGGDNYPHEEMVRSSDVVYEESNENTGPLQIEVHSEYPIGQDASLKPIKVADSADSQRPSEVTAPSRSPFRMIKGLFNRKNSQLAPRETATSAETMATDAPPEETSRPMVAKTVTEPETAIPEKTVAEEALLAEPPVLTASEGNEDEISAILATLERQEAVGTRKMLGTGESTSPAAREVPAEAPVEAPLEEAIVDAADTMEEENDLSAMQAAAPETEEPAVEEDKKESRKGSFWSRLWRRPGQKSISLVSEAPTVDTPPAQAESIAREDVAVEEAEVVEPAKEEPRSKAPVAGTELIEKKVEEAAAQTPSIPMEDIKPLIHEIRFSNNYRKQAIAKDTLIAMGPGVVPHVLPLLKDHRPIVRVLSIIILRETKAPESYPALVNLLSDRDSTIRYHAGLALVKMTGRTVNYYYNDVPENRKQAIARWNNMLLEMSLIQGAKKDVAPQTAQLDKNGKPQYWWQNRPATTPKKVATAEGGEATSSAPWWKSALQKITGKDEEQKEKKKEK